MSATYEVTGYFLLETQVRVVIEADSKEEAIDKLAEIAPSTHERNGWSATVYLKPPKGVEAKAVRVTNMEQTSGQDRAKKLE